MTRGIAPLILGYQAFDREVDIAGVILSRVGGSRHEAKLRAVIERYTTVPVLGAVAEDERLALPERHLGLLPCAEREGAAAWVHKVGEVIAAQVDLDRLSDLAAMAPVLNDAWASGALAASGAASIAAAATCRLRVGIARDRAFGFYYPDDLEALVTAGAELVFFDTLTDARLPPKLDALIIGGGFPETNLAALEANTALRTELNTAITAGLPTYAECGGLMLLSRSVMYQGRRAAMAGVIPGDAVMQPRPVGRGYVQLEETAAMPWPDRRAATAAGAAPVLGHEFHHASLENLGPGLRFAYRVRRGHGVDGRHDGICMHNLLASFTHLRGSWPRRFLAFAARVREERAAPSAALALQD
jgi:cobyrinic acid a,c-diamide synthase